MAELSVVRLVRTEGAHEGGIFAVEEDADLADA